MLLGRQRRERRSSSKSSTARNCEWHWRPRRSRSSTAAHCQPTTAASFGDHGLESHSSTGAAHCEPAAAANFTALIHDCLHSHIHMWRLNSLLRLAPKCSAFDKSDKARQSGFTVYRIRVEDHFSFNREGQRGPVFTNTCGAARLKNSCC